MYLVIYCKNNKCTCGIVCTWNIQVVLSPGSFSLPIRGIIIRIIIIILVSKVEVSDGGHLIFIGPPMLTTRQPLVASVSLTTVFRPSTNFTRERVLYVLEYFEYYSRYSHSPIHLAQSAGGPPSSHTPPRTSSSTGNHPLTWPLILETKPAVESYILPVEIWDEIAYPTTRPLVGLSFSSNYFTADRNDSGKESTNWS